MYSSKLIQILSVFKVKELERLAVFLESPYFNAGKKAKETLALFQHIYSYLPDASDVNLSKSATYKILYPDEVIVKGKLEKLMSRLLKLSRKFIIQEFHPIIGHEKQELLVLSNFFRTRQLDKLLNISTNKFQQLQEQEQKKNSDFYFSFFLYEKQITDYYSLYDNRKFDLNLPSTLLALDQYYLLTRLSYTCQLLAINLFIIPVDVTSSVSVTDHLLPLLNNPSFNIPLLQVYHKAYLLLRANDKTRDQHFSDFYKILNQESKELSRDQLKSLHTLVRNYSVLLYHQDNEKYKHRVFKLYQQHLEKEFLYHQNKLLPPTLENIVYFGIKCEDYDWVRSFLESHQYRITGTKHPEVVFNFNMSQYYFATKQYDLALEGLADSYEDVYYKVAAKRFEIKIFYETESNLLDSRIDAFKIYIYRLTDSQFSKKHKKGNRNFIDILKQIRLPTTFKNSKRIEKLSQKISSTNYIADKDWLIEKMKTMK